MTAPCQLLWIDLETTGDQPTDPILEVGAILTDSDLNVLDEFESLVSGPLHVQCLDQAIPVVKEMHEESGLAEWVRGGWGDDLMGVQIRILEMLKRNWSNWPEKWDDKVVVLAGSGVGHFDKRFIEAQLPLLATKLAYYVIDVGVLRRSLDLWGLGHVLLQNLVKPHRALADARLHLEEARTIRDALRSLGGVA